MRIGELAQTSGTPIETIRFYEGSSQKTENKAR
jgi:DNA-binding transcriptional MerR regulator